jgi:predicted DNA-binding transcriptional regulator YafY
LDRNFERQEDFSLSRYASQSFGVFHEEVQDVVLNFSPSAADDAANWVFHPSQTLEHQNDGSLIVRFRVGGLLELCWHLFTWGSAVRVLAPTALRDKMKELLSEVGDEYYVRN